MTTETAAKSRASLKDARSRPDPDRVEVLARICAGEVLEAFGMGDVEFGRRALERASLVAARRLAYKAAVYDEVVGGAGLKSGGVWAASQMAKSLEFVGAENVPEEGPLLIVSNHPGLSDTVALFSAIQREDLKIVAAERPFLAALPNTSRHLLTVDEESGRRFGLIRDAARHMKGGGTVVTFPGGGIDPDPALLPGAAEALGKWSESLKLFVRLVPNLTVVPVIVSGVLSRRALRNPVSLLRRTECDRRWLAATIQMLAPRLHGTKVRVEFGEAMRADGASDISEDILEEARRLIARSG
ncbi:MAG: 1-acyl-sn-glycerol-3-phosphate acyltransferase [Rubrobacter sp.]|nr:1-acyl-sn-glycerol-3-phosphate acyltransferase [Rubrobacter sp.]